MSDPIQVLDAAVYWADGFENSPSLTFLLNRRPAWDIYEKRPCTAEQGSAEQIAIVGARVRDRRAGWHVYWSADGEFATFFTWGGKPDDGFGGSRRTLTLTDGSTEEIVGGWHTIAQVAVDAGFPPVVDVAYRTNVIGGRLAGGTVCFITVDGFQRAVERLLPDCEVVPERFKGLTVKWRGQPSKAEFQAGEKVRRGEVRDRLKAKYHDGSWHGGDWYRRASKDERAELACRPYGALGPRAVVA